MNSFIVNINLAMSSQHCLRPYLWIVSYTNDDNSILSIHDVLGEDKMSF